MSKETEYLKNGMRGSSNGRNRWEQTEILKKKSKKQRRKQGRNEIKNQIEEQK